MRSRFIQILLALALIVPGLALAQEAGTKPSQPPVKNADPVKDWVKVLVARMDSKNETVRTSVGQALVSVGRPALPALQEIAKGKNASKAEIARRLISRIENPRRGGGAFGRGQRDPFAGMKLSTEQRGKADKALEANRAAQRQLREDMRNGEMDRSEYMEARRELSQKLNAELKGILTEDQFKQYRENTQRRGGGRRRRGGDG